MGFLTGIKDISLTDALQKYIEKLMLDYNW